MDVKPRNESFKGRPSINGLLQSLDQIEIRRQTSPHLHFLEIPHELPLFVSLKGHPIEKGREVKCTLLPISIQLLSGQGDEGRQMTRRELSPTDEIRRDLDIRVVCVDLQHSLEGRLHAWGGDGLPDGFQGLRVDRFQPDVDGYCGPGFEETASC